MAFSANAFAADFYAAQDFYKYTEPDGAYYWAMPDLELAVSAEIIRGYPANPPTIERDDWKIGDITYNVIPTLMPENTVTRAEFAAMLARTLGLDVKAINNPFSDVKPSDWFYEPVSELVNKNIIPLDYYNGKLNPDGNITREEIAIWLANAAVAYQIPLKNAPIPFSDYSNTAKYAPAISDAVGLKLISGYPDGTFKPTANADRAEAVTMLIRLIRLLPCDLTNEEAASVIANAEDCCAKYTQAYVPDVYTAPYRKHNPVVDNALKEYQQNAKDYVTQYNLYPWAEPTFYPEDTGLRQDPQCPGIIYDKGYFFPNLDKYIYKGLQNADWKSPGHLGPTADGYGNRSEYGIVDSMNRRNDNYSDGKIAYPTQGKFYVQKDSYKVIDMVTMGNIASVHYSRANCYDGFKVYDIEWKTTDAYALLVKQDGKWKFAAYDTMKIPGTNQKTHWLSYIKDRL
ncbi:MAG: S-layer homology domain-containing protein [Thermoanaerobacteraceae bacterium]|nr:S-layer homology domain-containing protein [Thermoanaerobacteraceae bacterium]